MINKINIIEMQFGIRGK